MSELPDFEAMTLDELIEWRVAKKAQINALRDEIRASNDVYKTKVEIERVQDRLRAANLPGVKVTPETLHMFVDSTPGE